MRSTRTTLIVAALVGLPLALAGCAGEAPEAAMEAAPAPSMRAPIVGTYQLVGRNVKDESGAWAPVEDFNSLGYITYSDRGYMAVNVMPLDREPFADDGEPTAEEVHAALQGYTLRSLLRRGGRGRRVPESTIGSARSTPAARSTRSATTTSKETGSSSRRLPRPG